MNLFRLPADERLRRLLVRAFIAVACILVLAVIAAFIWIYPPTGSWLRASITRLERRVIPQPQVVLMRTPSGNARYVVSGTSLKPFPPQGTHTRASFIVDEYSAPTSGGTPSLGAPVSSAPAGTLALVTDDGRLIALVKTRSVMRDLAGRPDGLVAYSSFTQAATTTEPDTWHVMVVDTAALGEAQDLGPGTDPAFAKNGNILALSPDGLVELNPFVNARMVRLGAPYAGAPGPALIAPDASYAVLPNSITGKEDVFSIDPAQPSALSYLGSLPVPQALGALTSASFLAQTDAGNATVYTVSKAGIAAGGTFTIGH